MIPAPITPVSVSLKEICAPVPRPLHGRVHTNEIVRKVQIANVGGTFQFAHVSEDPKAVEKIIVRLKSIHIVLKYGIIQGLDYELEISIVD